MAVFIWLGIMIALLVIEAITVGLTTIWFAVGALVAMIASILGVGMWGQVILFFVVSLVLLIFTRPMAIKYMNPQRTKTNYEDIIGKTVKVTENVDNVNATGSAVLNGQEWMARMQKDEVTLAVGEFAEVVAIEGVKLILVPVQPQ